MTKEEAEKIAREILENRLDGIGNGYPQAPAWFEGWSGIAEDIAEALLDASSRGKSDKSKPREVSLREVSEEEIEKAEIVWEGKCMLEGKNSANLPMAFEAGARWAIERNLISRFPSEEECEEEIRQGFDDYLDSLFEKDQSESAFLSWHNSDAASFSAGIRWLKRRMIGGGEL